MTTVPFLTRPLYRQVRDAMVKRIVSGEWKVGTAMPSEADLARDIGVSLGTMRKAFDLIESEHLVTRRPGRGTFVNDQGSGELAVRFNNIRAITGERVDDQTVLAEITEGKADQSECDRLRLPEHDPVYRIRCVRSYKQRPIMVETASVPAVLFPRLSERNGYSHSIVVLAQQYGIPLGAAQERVSIGQASPEIAKVLGIAPAAPIMVLDRVTQTVDKLPVEWRMGQCHLIATAHHYVAEMD